MMKQAYNWPLILTSFLVAFILTLLPMPDWTVWLRPMWVLMILVYWVMVVPHLVNVGIAWLLGIFLDVLNGTLLGEHALALVLVGYAVAKTHSRLRMFPLLQQAIVVFFLVLLYQLILFCIQGFIGQQPATWLYWTPPFTSMLLWPWLFSLMGRQRIKSI